MKTLIAVPSMDQLPSQFAQSLAMLQKEGDVKVSFQVGSLVYDARNKLAQKAMQLDTDYVLWLDSDMVFPPDTFLRMKKTMDEYGLDFLSGLYFRRVPPYKPVLFEKLERNEEDNSVQYDGYDNFPDGVFKIAGCGFGCVLMRTEVLMSVAGKFGGRMFDPFIGVGEDLSFCWRARQAGHEIWCDATFNLGHVGHVTITRDYYEAFKK